MNASALPLVSIIIPTFNRAGCIVEAIESVRAQTWSNLEIVVVDDGSTDDTGRLVAAIPDVKYLRQSNCGPASARNHGLRYATGKYICTLDSDDLWEPEFLQRSIEALESLDVDFVFSNWISEAADAEQTASYFEQEYPWWTIAPSRLSDWRVLDSNVARKVYLAICASPSSSLLFKREVLERGWTEGFRIADDWCLLLDAVLLQQRRVAFSMEVSWIKRVRGDNLFDKRDVLTVTRDLWIHDCMLFFHRYAQVMDRTEKARWLKVLAKRTRDAAVMEWSNRQFFSACWFALQTGVILARTFIQEPKEFELRLKKIMHLEANQQLPPQRKVTRKRQTASPTMNQTDLALVGGGSRE